MTIIYYVEELFTDLVLLKKWETVKEHYERCYKIKFKRDLTRAQIEKLYLEMQKLTMSAFEYQKK